MIRKIVTPTDQDLLLHLPEAFVGKQVEVLAFVVEEKAAAAEKGPAAFFPLNLDTRGFGFKREEANER